MCVRERERVSENAERERERERVSENAERERDREFVCIRERSVCVCVCV